MERVIVPLVHETMLKHVEVYPKSAILRYLIEIPAPSFQLFQIVLTHLPPLNNFVKHKNREEIGFHVFYKSQHSRWTVRDCIIEKYKELLEDKIQEQKETLSQLQTKLNELNCQYQQQEITKNNLNNKLFTSSQVMQQSMKAFKRENWEQMLDETYLQSLEEILNKHETTSLGLQKQRDDWVRKELEPLEEQCLQLTKQIQSLQSQTFPAKDALKLAIEIERLSEEYNPSDLIQIELYCHMNRVQWITEHTFKFDETTKSAQLLSFVKIQQKTGIDWKNVSLSICTMNHSEEATSIPKFTSSVLQATRKYSSLFAWAVGSVLKRDTVKYDLQETESHTQESSSEHLMLKLDCPHRATILSNSQVEQRMEWMVFNFSPSTIQLSRHTVPQLDTNVYLKFSATNTSSLPILHGLLFIYSNNTFIGEEMIRKIILPQQQFEIFLGKDSLMKIQYQKLTPILSKISKSFLKRQQMGTYQVQKKIIVTNLHTTEETLLEVKENYPISNEEQIELELVEPRLKKVISEKAMQSQEAYLQIDQESHMVVWNLKLKPKEVKECKVCYTVTLPMELQFSPSNFI